MNYYISDLHLFDKNTAVPVEDIIRNWNSVVSKKDDVYILGDVGHTSGNLVSVLKSLNGNKHLVRGNWDERPLRNRAFRNCFVEVRTLMEITDDGERIILFHYPMAEWNEMNFGTWHFYGHIHNNDGFAKDMMSQIPRAVNVSAEVIGYIPRTFKELRRKENPGERL